MQLLLKPRPQPTLSPIPTNHNLISSLQNQPQLTHNPHPPITSPSQLQLSITNQNQLEVLTKDIQLPPLLPISSPMSHNMTCPGHHHMRPQLSPMVLNQLLINPHQLHINQHLTHQSLLLTNRPHLNLFIMRLSQVCMILNRPRFTTNRFLLPRPHMSQGPNQP